MAEGIYDYVTQELAPNVKCGVYAPVGDYQDLLPYLIRRILENGTNNSFVNQINDSDVSVEQMLVDPLERAKFLEYEPHPRIPLPIDLFAPDRVNSLGFDVADSAVVVSLEQELDAYAGQVWKACSIVNGEDQELESMKVYSPANLDEQIGDVSFATPELVLSALDSAYAACSSWRGVIVADRAAILRQAATLLEDEKAKFLSLLMREGGKVISDAIAELREAVDFLRYYAMMAEKDFSEWAKLPGPAGEENYLCFEGRGVFVCISPWNFPLAIFLGPIAAALVSGNTVLAKPAEQTSLIAYEAVKLMHRAGIPGNVLHLLLGHGEDLSEALLSSERIAGVAFTGSTETANIINRTIAARSGSIIPFIAETGGLNAMIVDSSALVDQVTDDVIASAFKSVGQRCSSLRVLFLQEEIADRQIEMIRGAMQELRVGDNALLEVDLGPVIDQSSLDRLCEYVDQMSSANGTKLLCKTRIANDLPRGYFFAPCLFEIESISQLEREIFGPVLHVIRYKKSDLQCIIDAINSKGYGLTFAVQSRVQSNIDRITEEINVGNVYVNRNQVGAVVGVQPFG
ncbi:unnamed protein product, partial [Ixodes pacificus]